MLFAFLATAFAMTPTGCLTNFRSSLRPDMPESVQSSSTKISDGVHVIVHFERPNQQAKALAVLHSIETAWEVQVNGLGFRAPVLPDANGDMALDVYLAGIEPGTAFAYPDGNSDNLIGDGYSGTSAFIVVDKNLPDQWVDSYLSHEFNHVLQFATDFTELSLPIWEGTATMAQEWTWGPEVGKWWWDVDSFNQAPYVPTILGDSYYTYYQLDTAAFYEYGAALWVNVLDEHYYDGEGAGGVALWEATANEGPNNEPDAVDAVAAAAGVPLGEFLNEVALARFLVGDDWDPRGLIGLQERSAIYKVPVEQIVGFQEAFAPRVQPQILGQAFVEVDLSEAGKEDGFWAFTVQSESGLQSGVLAMWWMADGEVGESMAHSAQPAAFVPIDATRVVVAITNLGPTDYDGDSVPYVFGDQTLAVSWAEQPDTTTSEPYVPTNPGTNMPSPPGEGASEPEKLLISGGNCSVAGRSTAWLWSWMGALLLIRRRTFAF